MYAARGEALEVISVSKIPKRDGNISKRNNERTRVRDERIGKRYRHICCAIYRKPCKNSKPILTCTAFQPRSHNGRLGNVVRARIARLTPGETKNLYTQHDTKVRVFSKRQRMEVMYTNDAWNPISSYVSHQAHLYAYTETSTFSNNSKNPGHVRGIVESQRTTTLMPHLKATHA